MQKYKQPKGKATLQYNNHLLTHGKEDLNNSKNKQLSGFEWNSE